MDGVATHSTEHQEAADHTRTEHALSKQASREELGATWASSWPQVHSLLQWPLHKTSVFNTVYALGGERSWEAF